MKARAAVNLFRLHTAGWEILVFLSGPLLVRSHRDYSTWVVLALLAVMVNAFIFVLNDLADLPRDRLDPRRRNSPLVNKAVNPATALALSVALPICMWVIIDINDWSRSASTAFALCMLLGAYLDVFQKTSKYIHPLILDLLFAAAMAAPIIVGIAAVRERIPTSAWLLAASFLALCLALNSIGGNLKDIGSDLKTGFRTVAIALGVRMVGHRIDYSRAYRGYAGALSLAIAALFIWTGIDCAAGAYRVVAVAVVGLLGIGCVANIHSITSGRRRPSPNGRDRYFACGMVAYLVILSARSDLVLLGAVMGVVVAWEVLFRLARRHPTRQTPPVRAGESPLRTDQSDSAGHSADG
jgi:4-hydroxybenzoate polyprenyltransferase